jgi:folylpolyglutamate synthase/dihydrofolate synthase
MKFHEAANYLLDLRRFPQRPGTDATDALLDHLDHPESDIACVQVAGSNGKGSTAQMVESVLRDADLDVGLYTSPHLDDVRERIQVNGRNLSEAALVEFITSVEGYITENAAEGTPPTFFETLTALALWEFGRQDVDVAVLEVGIGGRYDATSVVDPVASAVTSVALEHTDILGDNPEAIARDKAHVAPTDRPLVTGVGPDLQSALKDEIGEITVVSSNDGDISVVYGGRDGIEASISVEGSDWDISTMLPLLGEHQAENAGVACGLLEQLADAGYWDFDAEVIARGLRNAHWPGRFEILQQEPLTVLDGAHNPTGSGRVAETLGEFEFDDLHLIIGSMADKNHRGIASALDGAAHVTACRPDHDRAEEKETIARAFELETDAAVSTRSDVAGALADALDAADDDDCVLVTGSLYTVAEARNRWRRSQIPKRIDSIDAARATLEGAHVTDAGTWRMRGKGVHRVIKTRVRPRQAQYLKEEMLSLGGECAISALNDQDQEPLDVVLMGTLSQYKRLCRKLEGQPYGLAPFGEALRDTLGISDSKSVRGYPWEDGIAVMGILNVTPDSFHDGGEFEAP